MQSGVKQHFIKRALNYNVSSSWVDDPELIRKIKDLARSKPKEYVLDIATVTGKIARVFCGHAHYVVGLDICREMILQARECADEFVLALAEKLPFRDRAFDVCVCRQGLQFMDLDAVISEICRILKPGGRVVLCHLTAYCEEDKEETFLIQKLRNPARKNFFMPEDIPGLLKQKAFMAVEHFVYITRESVNQWIDNHAIDAQRRRQIFDVYRNSSDSFKRIHDIEFRNGDIFDSMQMLIVKARKAG